MSKVNDEETTQSDYPMRPPSQRLALQKKVMERFAGGDVDTLIAVGQTAFRVGPVLFVNHSDQKDFHHAHIRSVQFKSISEVTSGELTGAGFDSMRGLLETLKRFDPEQGGTKGLKVRSGMTVTVTRFNCG
jgi:hypothetical protein